MHVFGIFLICFTSLIIVDDTSAIYTKGRGLRFYRRRQRSRSVPTDLKAPPTGQQIRLSHLNGENIATGRIEVFLRDKYGAICDSGWNLRNADVVCRQIGFLRGATTATTGGELGKGVKYVMDEVECDERAKNVVECNWERPDECGTENVAGVECKLNKGCPDGWIAGPTGCYQLLPNTVTRREFAVKKCAARGGHLINIETIKENHFISNAFWNESLGPILTGGMKVSGIWMWEKVSKESDGKDVERTSQVPIEQSSWFPGWQPGNYQSEPTNRKKERCLYLSNIFRHPNGSDINVGYHFWQNDRCSSTRKRLRSGFRYICEKTPEWTDVGCYSGNGDDYRGSASFTKKGTPCMKWTYATDINPETDPGKGLGDHNHCRNPDNDESPWCWISEGNFEFCNIPKCPKDNQDASVTDQSIDTEVEVKSAIDGNFEEELETNEYENAEMNKNDEKQDNNKIRDEGSDVSRTDTENNSEDETETKRDILTNENEDLKTIADTKKELSKVEILETDDHDTSQNVYEEEKANSDETRNDRNSFEKDETVNIEKEDKVEFEKVINRDIERGNEGDDSSETETSENIEEENIGLANDLAPDIVTTARPVGNNGGNNAIKEIKVDTDNYITETDNLFMTEESETLDTDRDTKLDVGKGSDSKTETDDDIQTELEDMILNVQSDEPASDNAVGHSASNINDEIQTESMDIIETNSNEAKDLDMTCNDDEFQCNDSCIPSHWKCDMEPDCKHGEDEGPACDYQLSLFKLTKGLTVRNYEIEIYAGATNETCAKYCLNSKRFVCRSFSFSSRTRECLLSHHTTETEGFKESRREHLYELRSQLNDCEGMFQCKNGRCLSEEHICDGADNCDDFSDETDCGNDEPVAVRLEGGSELAGRVEVFYKGEWGTICDDDWDVKDATVVCNMLGFSGPAKALSRSYYGSGDGNILLDDVGCIGNETSIELCEHSGWKKHDCYIWEIAAVKCTEKEDDPVCNADNEYFCKSDSKCISLNNVCDGNCNCTDCADEKTCDSKIELIGGETPAEGRVELTLNGIRGTICDDYFEDVDANVICKMLGYSLGTPVNDAIFGSGNGTIWMDDVKCIGNESDIITCPHFGPRDHNCGHDEDVGVICATIEDVRCNVISSSELQKQSDLTGRAATSENTVLKFTTYQGKTVTLRKVNNTTLEITVELEDGSDHSGRVVLTRNYEKGTICDDNWDDEDATVICRMLGFRDGKALTGDFYGPGDASMSIFLDEVNCRGDERSIDLCSHSDWLVHNCEHKEDAGVTCRKEEDIEKETISTTTTTSTTSTTSATSTFTTTVQTTVLVSTQSPIPSPESSDCISPGVPYAGKKAVTELDFDCQPWYKNSPHTHKHHNDSAFPDSSVRAAKNFCRSPDGDPVPWCYTTDPDERWQYCKIPKCKVDCYTVASEYTGHTSKTTSGHACQRWSLDTPHQHKYHTDEMFADGSVDAAANYCRSPDDDVTPWCYTTNTKERWEYCNISKCAGGFSFNKSCGLRPLENDRDRRDVTELEDSYDEDYLPYRKMGRIYGGSRASYGMYPWQAGIRRRLGGGFLSYHLHHCGGTIIGEYWILTAAHCFRDSSKGQIVVRTGDLDSGHRDTYEQEFDVETIIRHERYTSQDYDYDIALVKIKPIHGRGILFNDYVQPACLPNVTTKYTPGYQCLISGWGENEDEERSVYMKAARVPLVDQWTCNRLYKQTISSNMACAGFLAGGVDTCAGDSGGPLVCKIDDKYTIMGVVSFGEGCAVPNAPGVYARVAAFVPWIKEKLLKYN